MLSFRLLTLAVLGCALVAGCDRDKPNPAQPQAAASAEMPAGAEAPAGTIDRSHRGSLLPDFVLKDAAGKETPLKSLNGQPFLINLWATWCAPCVAELPTLAKLDASGRVKVVTVSQDLEAPEKIAPFLAAHGASGLPGWLDPANDLAAHYDAQTLPTTIYYDAQGREVWRLTGGHDWTRADTASLLGEAR